MTASGMSEPGSDYADSGASGKISCSGLIGRVLLAASAPARVSAAVSRLGVCAVVLPGPGRS